MTTFRFRVLALLIGVPAIVGVALAIALRGSHADAAESSPAPTPAQALHALARPATAADTPPSAVAKMIASGADIDQTGIRSFESTTGAGWLIPRKDSVCIAIPDPVDGFGVSCAPTSVAVEQGVYVLMIGPEADSPDVAFAPAKGTTVDVIDAAGRSTPLTADENGVIARRLPSGSKNLRITTADGTATTTPLPGPPPPPPTQGVGVVRSPR